MKKLFLLLLSLTAMNLLSGCTGETTEQSTTETNVPSTAQATQSSVQGTIQQITSQQITVTAYDDSSQTYVIKIEDLPASEELEVGDTVEITYETTVTNDNVTQLQGLSTITIIELVQPSPSQSSADEATQSSMLTSAQAQEIALADAGYTADQTKYINTYTEYNQGNSYYVVEFGVLIYHGETQYKYGIDCYSGEIVEYYTETH